jgi:NAD(P) transhydrogenase subunit alpha
MRVLPAVPPEPFDPMTFEILTITVFVLSVFLGFELIFKVPSMLHTPLMSGTNAIHGIILVGGMITLAAGRGFVELTAGFIAVVLGAANVFGGFMVTDRMLRMFKRKKR